jgi:UDP-N-acetylglucosamine--N-acetylmuramyl-(pentapeptide) pyrophosphoryl-undecaprenol N-acetylglucosamine transferase
VPPGTGTADAAAARRRFGIGESGRCLLVFGGSLGARSLNQAAIEAFGPEAPFAVLHACGERDHDELRRRLDELGAPPHYHLHPYVEPFADALAVADLAVARAGGSVFELAAAAVPAVLVPYPHATADHQTGNARWMADAGAAIVMTDTDLTAEALSREVRDLMADEDRLRAMSEAARGLAKVDAAARIAAEALNLAP